MITKMTKYHFIILGRESEEFMTSLQNLGVVDITRSSKPIDDRSSQMIALGEEYKKAISHLGRINFTGDADLAAIEKKRAEMVIQPIDIKQLPQLVDEAVARLANEKAALSTTEKLLGQIQIWGDFDLDKINGLSQLGLQMLLYSCPKNKFSKEWEQTWPLSVIAEDDEKVHFAVVVPENETVKIPATNIVMPEKNRNELTQDIERIKDKILATKATLLNYKDMVPELEKAAHSNLSNLDIYLAKAAKGEESVDEISVYTGFSPVNEDASLCKELDDMGVFYLKEKATAEDNPPIKLHNNKFASMFEVLTGMYGMPVYNEFDPTPILGPFFLLFFAMCMGDAGYGILLFLIGFLIKKVAPGMAKLAPLVKVLGVATFFIGLILGTFFGINLYEASWYPEVLKKFIIQGKVMGFDLQMVVALGIGVFHICLAMIVKGICFTCAFGFRKTVSTWGWCLLIIGGIITAALSLAGVMSAQVTKIVIIVIGVISALGIYIFNTPGRNPLANIGSGLWATYNMVTGLLGDVLSYIRLFALGLAGGLLGNAFNDLGMMAFNGLAIPGLNFVALAIILVIGHALNLAMSCLGAFVHPLRLTFVEYFKNVGYEGKGKLYNPLTNNK